MKHLFTLLTSMVFTVFASHSGIAQTFHWYNTTANSNITNGTPLVLNSNVSNAGILNSSEGKSPVVGVAITHPYCDDITITLTSPAGTTITLTSGNGGAGDNYTSTFFSHSATTPITSGSAPFTGNYLPEESLSAFDGELADGIWTMTIEDTYSADDGTFDLGVFRIGNLNYFSYFLDNQSILHAGSFANNLNLPTSGVTWGANIHNKANSALVFDGTNVVTTSAQKKPTTGITMAAWIKPSDVNSDQKIMGIADESNVTDLVSIGVYNGTADFEVREENGSGRISMGTLTNNEWVHIAGTWSVSDNTMRLYVNGELVGSTSGPGANLSFTPANTTSYFPTFGAAAWNTNSFRYEGSMDDMRAYDAALSEWEIKDLVANYNQYCETAVELPVEGNSCSGTYYAHNYGGNGVNGPSTQCAGNNGGASWFTVTVPASGNVTISSSEVTGSYLADNVIEIYDGTCGNLTYIDCEDDVNAAFAEVVLTGRTPGEVLYVKSWEYNNNTFGQYVICAFDPTLSIDEKENSISLNLYPNPANDMVMIQAELENSSDVSIRLMNSIGQEVKTIEINNAQSIQHSFDVSELPTGVYLVNLKSDKSSTTKRLIIKQ